ncbi:BTB family protein [Acanthamoeba polyphaga moumouvirus]|uniref:BTB family protein n=1 Tax=Acanthamoeba polyphaga moumouvirus TaxID=1269028 RepID=L7RDF5_9VIRU|nr:BTB family protein [Acanthamoeba polyphaga moumouvirus]AGC02088.1 BTB family protein [Acanthamoeba polyphaga moumouvirus]
MNISTDKIMLEIPIQDINKLGSLFQQLGINLDTKINYQSQQQDNSITESSNETVEDVEDELDPIIIDDLETTDSESDEITINDIVQDDESLNTNNDLINSNLSQHEELNLSSEEETKSQPITQINVDKNNSKSLPTWNILNNTANTISHNLPLNNTNNNKQSINQNLLNLNQYIERKEEIEENFETIQIEKKIILNVGGKKFKLKKSFLKHLNINYTRLNKINKGSEIHYFLDRDPYYFSKLIEFIKIHGLDKDNISKNLEECSDQFINELCYYGLVDKVYLPQPKLKLKKLVSFPSRHSDIIKIMANGQIFMTLSCVLSRSNFFENKLKINRSKQFFLNDVDPKIFRYVLNFLRCGEMYVSNSDILSLLDNYGIDYEITCNQIVRENIYSHFIPTDIKMIDQQMNMCVKKLDPRNHPNEKIPINYIDGKFYCPDNIFASASVENMNTITTNSPLEFDSEIIFDLTNNNLGECIEDILLCIDIPVLKPLERIQYVDNIEYKLIEHIHVVKIEENKQELLFYRNSDLLYIYPIIYKNNYSDYHDLNKIPDNNTKVLYFDGQNEHLIDAHRIILPLYLFKEKYNHLPVKKISENKSNCYLVVKMSPLNKLFKKVVSDIKLLNIFLVGNFVNFSDKINVINNKNSIMQVPVNSELKNNPMLYIYERTHAIDIPIHLIENDIYNITILPLDKYGFIKDFFFVIKENDNSQEIDKFSNSLIEMELLYVNKNSDNTQTLVPYSKFDTKMLNHYIPLKRLGYKLPSGIYYYSFSSDPSSSKIMGGLDGSNYIIRFKTKKSKVKL